MIFAATKIVSSVHSFSHQNSQTKILQTDAGFFEKIFHGEKNSEKNPHDCFLCAAADFQNKILFSANFIFAAAIFYFIFSARKFSRVKLSYLLNSFSSRAPPVIS